MVCHALYLYINPISEIYQKGWKRDAGSEESALVERDPELEYSTDRKREDLRRYQGRIEGEPSELGEICSGRSLKYI